MKVRPAVVVLVVAAIALTWPLAAASLDCREGGDADCCELECAVCLCCSHTPQTALSELDGAADSELDGRLRPEGSEKPREPLPRDVLHVPRSGRSS